MEPQKCPSGFPCSAAGTVAAPALLAGWLPLASTSPRVVSLARYQLPGCTGCEQRRHAVHASPSSPPLTPSRAAPRLCQPGCAGCTQRQCGGRRPKGCSRHVHPAVGAGPGWAAGSAAGRWVSNRPRWKQRWLPGTCFKAAPLSASPARHAPLWQQQRQSEQCGSSPGGPYKSTGCA